MLTCYKIRNGITGSSAAHLDSPLDLENLGSRKITQHGPVSRNGMVARLTLIQGPPKEPDWGTFLRGGFDDLELPKYRTVGAVLIVQVRKSRKSHTFAFPFGTGRYLLRESSIERNYGLKVALNSIFQGEGELDPSRIRAVDSKTLSETVLHTRQQASRSATFEVFEIDSMRDILNGITGRPVDQDLWGDRIDGRDSLGIGRQFGFDDLPQLCTEILSLGSREDYKKGFGWIDNISLVRDEDVLDNLEQELLSKLRERQISQLDLAPPEVIDWSAVSTFRFSSERKTRHPEIRLFDYLSLLSKKQALQALDIDRLKRDQIEAINAEGAVAHRWSVWRCLTGHLSKAREVYILDNGGFYGVESSYLEQLNSFIAGLPQLSYTLPQARQGDSEPDYLQATAELADDLLLMDQRFVRVTGVASPIELCDLLTDARQFVHVKRQKGSANLSHLFAQGVVAADLMLMHPGFRDRAVEVIREVAETRQLEADRFISFDVSSLRSADHEVAFAIIARWPNDATFAALPFFSKVNLRKAAQELRRMGFTCSVAKVAAV